MDIYTLRYPWVYCKMRQKCENIYIILFGMSFPSIHPQKEICWFFYPMLTILPTDTILRTQHVEKYDLVPDYLQDLLSPLESVRPHAKRSIYLSTILWMGTGLEVLVLFLF